MQHPSTRTSILLLITALLGSLCAAPDAIAQDAPLAPAEREGVEPGDRAPHLDVSTTDREMLDNPLYKGDIFALEGDIYRAITQYKLYLMRPLPKDEHDAVKLKIAWLYLQADKLPAAASTLKEIIIGRQAYDRLSVWARLYYAKVALRAEQGNVAVNTYESLLKECAQLVELADAEQAGDAGVGKGDCQYIEGYARLGLASYYAKVHDFERSVAQLAALDDASPLKPKTKPIADYVSDLKLPRKRPVLAGALSIVPGLGHVYIEEYGSALVAAVWNGAFIWAFVDSLQSRKYGQATLIGVVEFVWYSGTIFGAVAGAHRFNRDARRIVEQGMLKDIGAIDDNEPWIARFPTAPAPPLQLHYTWEF